VSTGRDQTPGWACPTGGVSRTWTALDGVGLSVSLQGTTALRGGDLASMPTSVFRFDHRPASTFQRIVGEDRFVGLSNGRSGRAP
jgi:hypothetical protein